MNKSYYRKLDILRMICLCFCTSSYGFFRDKLPQGNIIFFDVLGGIFFIFLFYLIVNSNFKYHKSKDNSSWFIKQK